MTPSEKRNLIEALRDDYLVRQISETLGFNRNLLYYQPKIDPSEEVLRTEIEELAARYPTYGYRRITKLLVRMGCPVGYRRVARLMKSVNLSVSVKRICQTTKSLQGVRPWVNRLQTLEVSRCDQVWVGDITYVRLKGHFIYVCLLMDVFTRMIRAWHLSQHLTQSLTLKPLEAALHRSVPEIHHSDQGVQYCTATGNSDHFLNQDCVTPPSLKRKLSLRHSAVKVPEQNCVGNPTTSAKINSRSGQFITQAYHQKRPHSAIGYLTPVEFQRQNLEPNFANFWSE